MRRGMGVLALASSAIAVSLIAVGAPPQEPPADEVKERTTPLEFEPFQHLIGAWKGTGVPEANRLKGWTERHLWAWRFADGKPVGMAITFEDDKTLSEGKLSYDAETRTFRLDAKDADDKPVVFEGALNKRADTLTLDRKEPKSDEGEERYVLRLNSNMIRYQLILERKEPRAPQYSRVIVMNMGKEGESFAAGGGSSNLPKCILTGGTATMTVSFEGKSYPVCCTGCRDEFNENPQKYIARLAKKEAASGGKPAKAAPSRPKDDGAFDGLLGGGGGSDDDPAMKKKAAPRRPRTKDQPKAKSDDSDDEPAPEADDSETESDEDEKPSAGDDESRASTLLRLGGALERSGKASAALNYYRKIVKDYPDTKAAKTASSRIKKLEDN